MATRSRQRVEEADKYAARVAELSRQSQVRAKAAMDRAAHHGELGRPHRREHGALLGDDPGSHQVADAECLSREANGRGAAPPARP